MKRKINLLLLFVFVTTISLLSKGNYLVISANTIPYYTSTRDSISGFVRTADAYSPGDQLFGANGEPFKFLEDVFIDHEGYIYITDSGNSKIYIFDPSLNFINEITNTIFFGIKSTFVTHEKIYIPDSFNKTIYIYDREQSLNKEISEVIQPTQEVTTPNSPIFKEGYKFVPTHLVVDARGNMYVRSNESLNGLMMLNEEGEFITFFGGNPLRIPLLSRIKSLFLSDVQKEKFRTQQEIYEDVVTNVAINDKGYIYTVTSTLSDEALKKFNVAGTNYFTGKGNGYIGTRDLWVGKYGNIFTVEENGYINEYDENGNLLFVFGVRDTTTNRVGLLNQPVSIATDKEDQLYVLDQGNNLLQIYKPTPFSDAVHQATYAYNREGNFKKAKDLWSYTLEYNGLFDTARVGLGDSYLRLGNYEQAYEEYMHARYKEGISETYILLRQDWLDENLKYIVSSFFVFIVLKLIFDRLTIRKKWSDKLEQFKRKIRKNSQLMDELLYIPQFLKHPLNGFYSIKREKRVSVRTATIIYLLLMIIFIAYYEYTNILFVDKYAVVVPYQLFIVSSVVILWVVANYFVCLINDGEGSFKNVYISTAMSLSPIIVCMPFIILLSNVLTYQEVVFYQIPIYFMILWIVFLMFFMIKDIHNYEVVQTIKIILKSFFTMLIMALFIFVIYSLNSQLFDVIREISREVANR